AAAGGVELIAEPGQVALRPALFRRIERGERLEQRPVISPENIEPVLWGAVAKRERALRRLDRRRVRLEQLGDARARPPQGRRLGAGRRRQGLADDLEDLADESLRRPVGETHPAAALAHADELGGGALLVGREHDAEGR